LAPNANDLGGYFDGEATQFSEYTTIDLTFIGVIPITARISQTQLSDYIDIQKPARISVDRLRTNFDVSGNGQ